MDRCKELLLQNGQVFLAKCNEARGRIARVARSWILNGSVRPCPLSLGLLRLVDYRLN